jgi:hypothetical protein
MRHGRAKGKTGARKSRASASTESRKQVDLDSLRQKIANHVGGKTMAMLRTTTDECVKVGNLSAIKYLFEVIGLCPASATANAERADSDDLTRALLNRLDFGQQEDAKDGKARVRRKRGVIR